MDFVLAEYNYELLYDKGSENCAADRLSRFSVKNEKLINNLDDFKYVNFVCCF